MINKFNFNNDYLLLDSKTCRFNFITANDLLLDNNYKIIILPKNILNLYTALVKRIDFTPAKLIGAIPFFKIDSKYIDEFIPPSYKRNFYRKLRKYFSYYINGKRIGRIESFRLWFKKQIFPAIILRLISNISSSNKYEEMGILANLIKRSTYITNFQNEGKIYLPKTLNELNNKKLAYFVGCSIGDGELNTANHWTLVDGDSNDLNSSLQFIENLKKLSSELFNLEFTEKNPRLRGNKYEFWISNKSLCRFLNFFFGLPYGKKKNKIEKPKIFDIFQNNGHLSKFFWMGMFDTDGCCEKNGYRITLSSATYKIVKACKCDLKNMGLDSKIRVVKSTGVNLLNIDSTSFKTFGNQIGFLHPRKMKIYQNKLIKYQLSKNRKRI